MKFMVSQDSDLQMLLTLVGESQPVYEEFGSILLLVLASKRRLALTISELGMQEGFVARYLDQEGTEIALSEESSKHLGDWIYAMYVAEGLSDEVTTTCSPQEFYLLVPSLLRQSILAFQKGKLNLDALKGGLDCECCLFGWDVADFQIFSSLSSSLPSYPP